jgi:hypothetical protein
MLDMQAGELLLDVVRRPVPRTALLAKHRWRDRWILHEDAPYEPPQRSRPAPHLIRQSPPNAVQAQGELQLHDHATNDTRDEELQDAIDGAEDKHRSMVVRLPAR